LHGLAIYRKKVKTLFVRKKNGEVEVEPILVRIKINFRNKKNVVFIWVKIEFFFV